MSESWPRRLLDWYRSHARDLPWRNPPGRPLPPDAEWPYRVWLSEIMLQQTTVAAATPYFRHFTSRWPSVAALAAADDAEVMQAWAGLGYYARARNLLACARAVVARHGGRFPVDEAALKALPGIGDYTAAAVAAFGHGRDAVVIDGNVERVASRLFAIAQPLPAARPALRAALSAHVPGREAADFAQAMMDLARRICTPRNPGCPACPIADHCMGRSNAEAYPAKPPKRARPTRRGTAWWMEADGRVLTVLRPARGLLGGMRALPSCEWTGPGAAPPVAGQWRPVGVVRHGFTHFELELAVNCLRLPAQRALDLPGAAWLSPDELSGLPTLFSKAAALALAHREEAA